MRRLLLFAGLASLLLVIPLRARRAPAAASPSPLNHRSFAAAALVTAPAVKIHRRWIEAAAYTRHQQRELAFHDALGAGRETITRWSGLAGAPDLVRVVRVYRNQPFAVLALEARNHTRKPLSLEAFRLLQAKALPRLGAPGRSHTDAIRVLAGSYSEDPAIHIASLAHAPRGGYFGVDDLLLFDRRSRQGLLLAALTSQRFLTILRLRPPAAGAPAATPVLTVDSTGTTAAVVRRDRIQLSQQLPLELTLAPGQRLRSEKLMLAAGRDPVELLENYGRAVRRLHHPRFMHPAPMGWWSWTAFYGGINAGEAITNAQWLSRHLLRRGFNYFHLDEGYQYARGEYTTPNAAQFPDGMRRLEFRLRGLGLTPALWTAPFEVSARARIFRRHPEWLVKDAQGRPIRLGYVTGRQDALYALDPTDPGAQAWLRRTYRLMVRQWGIRAFKLDFMDSAAVEGRYYRPNTTALEAQRIGLEVIRQAVGPQVLLDKDGCPMLNPIGLVQAGRISVDTGHSFGATRTAAWNIAARFYMNRNFYTSDPDAFSVSRQLEPEEHWHQSPQGLTQNEAQAQIVLAALAGGMYELGDDLPTLGAEPRRLALVENRELLALNRLGRAARPLDLMTFARADGQPSEFFLREDRRQAMLAVFNWTGQPRSHAFRLAALGFAAAAARAYDALAGDHPVALSGGMLRLDAQAPHSVRLIKLVNAAIPPAAPRAVVSAPSPIIAGHAARFAARLDAGSTPAWRCRWSFGDGTAAVSAIVAHAGAAQCRARHTYTLAGDFHAAVAMRGLDGLSLRKTVHVRVTGYPTTRFELQRNRRYQPVAAAHESTDGS